MTDKKFNWKSKSHYTNASLKYSKSKATERDGWEKVKTSLISFHKISLRYVHSEWARLGNDW